VSTSNSPVYLLDVTGADIPDSPTKVSQLLPSPRRIFIHGVFLAIVSSPKIHSWFFSVMRPVYLYFLFTTVIIQISSKELDEYFVIDFATVTMNRISSEVLRVETEDAGAKV